MAVASFLLERCAHPFHFGIPRQRSMKLSLPQSDVGRKLALDVKVHSIEKRFFKDLYFRLKRFLFYSLPDSKLAVSKSVN